MGTPHQSPVSCLVSLASRLVPSSVAGSANHIRPSPEPMARKPSSTRSSWGPPLPTNRIPAPRAIRSTAATIMISSPIPAAISAANATPRVAATSPACGPNRGLVRGGEVRTAIGRLLLVPASLPGRGERRQWRWAPKPRVYLGLPWVGGPACARVTGIRTGMVGNMALAQRTVLILAADDFEDMELLYPLYRLAEEDVEVTVAGLDDHPVHGKKGHGPVPVDTTVEQVAEADFDALVIPGGYAPDKLRRSETVLDLVRAFDGAGKPIAFICHAGWVPISARIVKGRRATSVGAIRDDMVNAGADWVDEATVVDGNLISARTPADLGPWIKALLKALAIG